MNKKKIIQTIILVPALLLVYAPILILAVYSFTDATQIGMGASFSFDNYIYLFTTEELRSMILGTLALAVGSAILATVLGTLGAMGAFYSGKKMRSAYTGINRIPVVNADVVTGFSLCILLVVVFGMSKESFFPLVAGHVTLCAPFVFLSVYPKLGQMDKSLYEAALDLGAPPMTALWKVVIPEILPGILSGFAMAVTLSLDDYFVATYTKPATFDTISTYVVNATRGSQTEVKTALWALSTIIFVVVLIIAFAGNRNKDAEKKIRRGAEVNA
ncbi:MAG: ABC transporter permease [Lachnospiraceae bacterium]|nr:ABC transporter permease [Lachnospiraceae bacterium]